VHLKKTKSNVISAETKQTLSPKQNNMQHPNVILGCDAKLIKIYFPNQKNNYEMQYATTKCHPRLLCQIDKNLFSKPKKIMKCNMQQPNVILGCYAKLIKICFPNQKTL